jgi:uncharacterized membrane protein
MNPSVAAFYVLLILLAYLVAPSMIIWGWIRWARRKPRRWTVAPTFSFLGFLLASVSGLIGLFVVIRAQSGGFMYNSSIYDYMRCGSLFSLVGLLISLGGIWRENSIRWHAPVSALATLAFWLLAEVYLE